MLQILLDAISALLNNLTLFIEPYVSHPRIVSPLLMRPFQPHRLLPSLVQSSTLTPTHCTHPLIRRFKIHPSFTPRVMTPLLRELFSTGKSRGTMGGAIRDPVGVGKGAIRKGFHRGTRA